MTPLNAARARAGKAAKVAARDHALRLHLAPLVAAGLSLTAMAAALDKLRIEPPYARTCNTRQWHTSTIRDTLKRLGLYPNVAQRKAA